MNIEHRCERCNGETWGCLMYSFMGPMTLMYAFAQLLRIDQSATAQANVRVCDVCRHCEVLR